MKIAVKWVLASVLGLLLLPLYVVLMGLELVCGLSIMAAPIVAAGIAGDFIINYLRACGHGELTVMFLAFIIMTSAALLAFYLACYLVFLPLKILEAIDRWSDGLWRG